MLNKAKILIVEDEKKIATFIKVILTQAGYDVITADKGNDALTLTASHKPDMILLDLGLPDMDGIEVLRLIREWSEVPIIVVSARQNESEIVEALDSGAHDYVSKPFGNDVLLARIRTCFRISQRSKDSEDSNIYSNGQLFIDYEKRIVKVADDPVHLTPFEYKILLKLAQNEGKVLTHEYIMRDLWGYTNEDNQILRVNITNIRRKIEENSADPKYIQTEVGVGYRMNSVITDE